MPSNRTIRTFCLTGADGAGKTALVERARALPGMEGQDLATRISTPTRYEWRQRGADAWTEAARADEERPRPAGEGAQLGPAAREGETGGHRPGEHEAPGRDGERRSVREPYQDRGP